MAHSSEDTTIHGGDLNAISNYHYNEEIRNQEALKKLYDHIAPGAFHNSEERYDPPRCHPQTRLAIQKRIIQWAKDCSNNSKLIMWLNGPAGAGKSAIMQTIAELLEKEGILGASFFFFRSGLKRNIKTHLVATISYQLSLTIPYFRECVADAISRDPSIFTKTLAAQMKALVINPFCIATTFNAKWVWKPYLILIDGLDECAPEDAHKEIITLLSTLGPYYLRYLVASRPEYIIRSTFSISSVQNQTMKLALDDNYEPDADIRLYFLSKLGEIKSQHPMGYFIPSTWPTDDHLKKLVQTASGQFIYAETVLKFIECPRNNPIHRLDAVLATHLSTEDVISPFSQLDALYHQIFDSVKCLPKVLDIVYCVLHLNGRDGNNWTGSVSCEMIETLLGYSSGEALVILCDMHSLLQFQPTTHETYIRPHHASLQDFLLDPLRSRHLHIEPQNIHESIFIRGILHYDKLRELIGFAEIIRGLQHTLSITTVTDKMITAMKAYNIYNESVYDLLFDEPQIGHTESGTRLEMQGSLVEIKALDGFYQVAFDKTQVMQPPDVQVYNHLVDSLDIWLAEILKRWIAPGPDTPNNKKYHWIILLTIFSTVPTPFSNVLDFRKYVSFRARWLPDNDMGLFHAILTITGSSDRHTYRVFKDTPGLSDRLTDHSIQFILDHPPWHDDHFNGKSVHFDATFNLWAQYLQNIVLRSDVKPQLGSVLARFLFAKKVGCCLAGTQFCVFTKQGNCNVEHCTHGGYLTVEALKKDLHSLAIAVSAYIMKCGIDMDQHPYTPTHLVCFSCQSKEVFLNDSSFGRNFWSWSFEINNWILGNGLSYTDVFDDDSDSDSVKNFTVPSNGVIELRVPSKYL